LDGDLSPTQSSRGAKRVPRHAALLGSADMRVVAAECEVMCTAVESLESLGLWKAVTLVVHFPPLVIDFLALAFGTDVERAHAVYTSIGAVDINQYTLRRLVEELGVHESPGEDDLLERVAELLRRRSLLPVALYGIHALVMRATCGSAGPFSDMFEQLREEIAGLLPRGYTHCAAGASDSIVLSKCAKIASGASTSSPASHAQQEQYVRRMGHMLALAKLLRSLDHQESFYMESISSSHAVELCEGSIDFPSFSCYVGADRAEELAVVGGTFVGESGRLQCYAEYLVAALLSCHRLAVGYGGSLGPNSVDVVVTCQSSKLLPAAASVSCRLIDAGISCECRALPLIHTDHFNERLRQAGGVKFRVHLQGSGGSGSGLESCGLPSSTESLSGERSTDEDEAGDAPADLRSAESWHSHQRSSIRDAAAPVRRHERQGAASALESETAPDADAFSKKAAAGAPMDYDDDRTFSGVSFQVEPLRECYGQPRKIDSGAALVRYMKALLSRDGQ
ncbi:serine-threonine protein kinase, partial [Babesia caballi]